MNGTRLGELSSLIKELINPLIRLLGIKILPDEQDAFNQQAKELAAFVQNNYRNRRKEEVLQAYTMLVMGKLGVEAYRELNPASFGAVMKAYDEATRADRAKISETLNALPEPETRKPSEAELEILFQKTLADAGAMVKKGAVFLDYGNYLYEELLARNMVSWTVEDEDAAIAEARKQLAAEKTAQRDQETNSIRRMDFERAIQAISDGTAENQIIPRAKRILVNQYLRKQ